jgi:hypothetical protein
MAIMSKANNQSDVLTMAPADAAIIRRLAAITAKEAKVLRGQPEGTPNLHTEAVEVYRRYVPTLGFRGTPEMCFMSEVDNPCPDLALRASYRKALLAQGAD